MWNALIEPLQYDFMVQAILVASLVGAVCAILSCYLVLKGWSLMGDALSHAVLPGVVIAYVLSIPLSIGAFLSGIVCAGATGWIKSNSRIKEDTVLGVVFTGLFAFGLILFTKVESEVHLNHVLFGNILGIENNELIQSVIISIVTLIVVMVMKRDLMLYCFDIGQAKAIGLNVNLLHYVFLVLVAATIVAALQAVGIILTVAMLITPGCTAYLLSDRFNRMLMISAGTAIFSACFGTYLSYFINGATGACIVLSQSALFILAMFLGPKHGILFRFGRTLNPTS